MEPVIAGIALGIVGAILFKMVSDTSARVRGWYHSTIRDSLAELVVVMAVLGALVGALYTRSRH